MDKESKLISDMIYRRIMPTRKTADELGEAISKELKILRDSEIQRD